MNPVTGLSLGRIAIGALAVAKPDVATKSFGIDVAANPQSTFMTRLFGAREVAIGVATLVSSGRGRTGLVLLGIGVDGADAYAGLVAPKEDGIDQRSGMVMTAVAAGAVLGGLAGLLPSRRTSTAAGEVALSGRAARKARKKQRA